MGIALDGDSVVVGDIEVVSLVIVLVVVVAEGLNI